MTKTSIIIFSLYIPFSHAETIIYQTHSIPTKYNLFSGNIPYIQGKDFDQVNQQIKQQLLADEDTPINFSSEKIYQNQNYLSIHTHLEIEGGRSYYREKYFVVDLKTKKLSTLKQILKKYQLSEKMITARIAEQIRPCINDLIIHKPELCESIDMQYLFKYYAEDQNFIHLKNADSFYLKKNILGISFDAGAYSVAFEYNLKTGKIQ
ncbi:hypothetical protein [Acinetobacter sp. Marseille-Q1618]|uniref:hypothetical protein n=1 Tax=Acinetobacter sp. Marseille-Q1618 TaxID=2697502 RepID=UPI00156E2F72|nr:hypothetical protein [Acinetobacter sp. Marseille-Q1618]